MLIERRLLLVMRAQVQVGGVYSEERMTVVPGKFDNAVLVNLRIYSNLVGVADLAILQPVLGVVHAAFNRVYFRHDQDAHRIITRR